MFVLPVMKQHEMMTFTILKKCINIQQPANHLLNSTRQLIDTNPHLTNRPRKNRRLTLCLTRHTYFLPGNFLFIVFGQLRQEHQRPQHEEVLQPLPQQLLHGVQDGIHLLQKLTISLLPKTDSQFHLIQIPFLLVFGYRL
jgi:hypothetical protein